MLIITYFLFAFYLPMYQFINYMRCFICCLILYFIWLSGCISWFPFRVQLCVFGLWHILLFHYLLLFIFPLHVVLISFTYLRLHTNDWFRRALSYLFILRQQKQARNTWMALSHMTQIERGGEEGSNNLSNRIFHVWTWQSNTDQKNERQPTFILTFLFIHLHSIHIMTRMKVMLRKHFH